MRTIFNKHKYVKVITHNKDKSITIKYYKRDKVPNDILINPDHIFNHNGYSTIILTSESAESINPLNFKSKYNVKMFQSAINNKIIEDTFSTLKTNRFDLQQILMFLSLVLNFIILYMLMKQMGVF